MKRILLWAGVLYIALTGGGGCNVFSDIADKRSDAVIMDDVNNLIDAGKWNDAVLLLQTLSSAGQASRAGKLLFANAYAGRGGLDILNLANSLNGSSTSTFFQLLMTAFKGSTVSNYNDIVTAEGYMLSISQAATGRTSDENIFTIFLEMAKLGTLFAATADTDSDGSVDATFDSCTMLSATQASHVVTAIGIIVDSMNAATNSIITSTLSTMTTYCSDPMYNAICGVTDISSVSAVEIRSARTIAAESNMGVGLKAPLTMGKCEIIAPYGAACEGTASIPTNLCP